MPLRKFMWKGCVCAHVSSWVCWCAFMCLCLCLNQNLWVWTILCPFFWLFVFVCVYLCVWTFGICLMSQGKLTLHFHFKKNVFIYFSLNLSLCLPLTLLFFFCTSIKYTSDSEIHSSLFFPFPSVSGCQCVYFQYSILSLVVGAFISSSIKGALTMGLIYHSTFRPGLKVSSKEFAIIHTESK